LVFEEKKMGCLLYFRVRSPVFTGKQMAEILNTYSKLPCLPLPFPITEKPIQEGIPFSLYPPSARRAGLPLLKRRLPKRRAGKKEKRS